MCACNERACPAQDTSGFNIAALGFVAQRLKDERSAVAPDGAELSLRAAAESAEKILAADASARRKSKRRRVTMF